MPSLAEIAALLGTAPRVPSFAETQSRAMAGVRDARRIDEQALMREQMGELERSRQEEALRRNQADEGLRGQRQQNEMTRHGENLEMQKRQALSGIMSALGPEVLGDPAQLSSLQAMLAPWGGTVGPDTPPDLAPYTPDAMPAVPATPVGQMGSGPMARGEAGFTPSGGGFQKTLQEYLLKPEEAADPAQLAAINRPAMEAQPGVVTPDSMESLGVVPPTDFASMIDSLSGGEQYADPTGQMAINIPGLAPVMYDPEAIQQARWQPAMDAFHSYAEAEAPEHAELAKQHEGMLRGWMESTGLDPKAIAQSKGEVFDAFLKRVADVERGKRARLAASARSATGERGDANFALKAFEIGKKSAKPKEKPAKRLAAYFAASEGTETVDAERLPDGSINPVTLAAIVYALAETNDPGARKTDKDISYAMGEQSVLDKTKDEMLRIFTGRRPEVLEQVYEHLRKTADRALKGVYGDLEQSVKVGMRGEFNQDARDGFAQGLRLHYSRIPDAEEAFGRLGIGVKDPQDRPPPPMRSSSRKSRSVRVDVPLQELSKEELADLLDEDE